MGTREVAGLAGAAAGQGLDGAYVLSVNQSGRHGFCKQPRLSILLVTGLGAEGDAHLGKTVQHLYRKRKHPDEPNLRQIHLIHAELYAELEAKGLRLGCGEIGENVTTRNLDLLGLPAGARLHLGDAAIVEVTGLRDPCVQMDRYCPGLMAATLGRDTEGRLVRKAGVMGTVLAGGEVRAGDAIRVELPAGPHRQLVPV